MSAEGKLDPFQMAWQDPSAAHAVYVDEEHGLMVMPDARPVVETGHLLVVTREAVPFEQLPPARQRIVEELVRITREHIQEVLKPARKVGVCLWGNQIPTAHWHVFPRNNPKDGELFFDDKRPRATEEQLEKTRRALDFSAREGFVEEVRKRIGVVAAAAA